MEGLYDDCIQFVALVTFLPHSDDPQQVFAAVTCLNGITHCIWELLSDVILAVCTCVAFKYNQVKQKYVVFEKWDDG